MLLKLNRYLTKFSILFMTAALVAGMVGCNGGGGGYPPTPPPSQNLEIQTWYDLDAVRDNLGGNHTLMNDLDSTSLGYEELASPTANQGKGWEPIGTYIPEWGFMGFMGTFDGQGHEMRDLFINRPDENFIGLFHFLEVGETYGIYGEGVIKDIGVVNATVIGKDRVGGLVGQNEYGTVFNSYFTGNVTGENYVGGLVGWNHHLGTVSNSYSTSDVTGDSSVGGLVGENSNTVSDSYSTGSVTGKNYVGGLMGGNSDFATVSYSHSSSSVTGDENVGGLVGSNDWSTVSYSHSTGSVTGDVNVGGLVGENDYAGTVNNSYSTGSVTGEDIVGGLVGWHYQSTVSNSYSTGSVTGYSDVCGLVGAHVFSVVSNSFYNYDEVLINGENIITIGALSNEDFEQWLANGKLLDVSERLSYDNGYYMISNVSDFKQLLAFGQNDALKFRLTNDLDLAAESNFYIPYLAGEFDGNGHKISNLSFNFDFVSLVGLFGYLAPGGKVTQVGAENVNITGEDIVGGLVGWNHNGTVSDSYATGTVTGDECWGFGGLVGWIHDGTVSNSYSTGSVTGGEFVGGLVGLNEEGTVSNSYSTCSVTGDEWVGGLVGFDGLGVSNSYYNYDEVLINGENIITIGALFGEDFDQWLANDKFLDVNERLSQENGYYVVNNVSDFKQLLAFGQDGSLKFRLKNDLDLATEPGLYIPYLAGEFDGNGHKISNLSFNFDFVSPVGLFGYLVPGGKVSQVGVEDVNITVTAFVGGLVGINWEGTVSDCYSTGSVTGYGFYDSNLPEDMQPLSCVGGLVGINSHGTVNNSSSTGSVTGEDFVGGLVGDNQGTVSNSHFTGDVTGEDHVGGLAGDGGDVSNSHSTGSVTGEDFVGGLVGYISGTVSNSYFTGSVTGDYYVGGLVGKGHVNVSNSYSTGSVTGEEYVGGLMGWSRQTVSNSYSTSSVTGDYYVGGLVGDNHQGTVSDSFWDRETSGQTTSAGGTGKTTAAMKSLATLSGVGWNIIAVGGPGERNPTYIWNIVNGVTYPFLSWQS